jgi:hypothetical protein
MKRLRYDVWLDEELGGGLEWWRTILSQIRLADVIIVAVSPDLLASEACASERSYARQLGKSVLPVCVRQLHTELLPPDLAQLQMVDYKNPDVDAAFALADALAHMPPAPPLPEPLPPPPPMPVSYLSDLAARVRAPTISLDDQLSVVARLGVALRREGEREPASELLRVLQERDDLYYQAAREIEKIMATRPAEVAAPPAPSVDADWYEDPTHRFPLRYFDGDWSDWVYDGSKIVEDRL